MNAAQMVRAARMDAGIVAVKPASKVVRVIFRCKRCQTVEAHEYINGNRVLPGTTTGVMAERGIPVTCNDDERCPTCRRYRQMTTVTGHYNPEHVCNSKCMGAVGPSCDCSCGGQNHGGAHLS